MANPENQPVNWPAWLTCALVLSALALGGVWLKTGMIGAERWPIRWLEVEGDLARTTVDQVRAAVAPQAGRGFFAVGIEPARRAVEELPWVASAEVTRQWPDSLTVRVTEHRPVARWNQTGLISRAGHVFDVAGSQGMQGLPRLSGPETRREAVIAAWHDMRARLAPAGLDVESIALDARGAWQVELDNGLVLLLGREHLAERLERFLAVAGQLAGNGIIAVDLRYTNGLAVRTAGDEETEAEESRQHG